MVQFRCPSCGQWYDEEPPDDDTVAADLRCGVCGHEWWQPFELPM